jgi:hypothetical protein
MTKSFALSLSPTLLHSRSLSFLHPQHTLIARQKVAAPLLARLFISSLGSVEGKKQRLCQGYTPPAALFALLPLSTLLLLSLHPMESIFVPVPPLSSLSLPPSLCVHVNNRHQGLRVGCENVSVEFLFFCAETKTKGRTETKINKRKNCEKSNMSNSREEEGDTPPFAMEPNGMVHAPPSSATLDSRQSGVDFLS